MLATRNLLLLAVDLYCSVVFAETRFLESPLYPLAGDGKAVEKKTFVECSLLEKYHKEGRISQTEYHEKLKACKGTVVTDVTPTGTLADTVKGGLKIYFTDDDIENHPEQSETANNINGLKAEAPQDEKNLQKILLTSNDYKQINSRHELYKNPKTPQIKFRTESPSNLRTVASPLLVQNSVRNKLREKVRPPTKRKRAIKSQLQKSAVKENKILPKAYQINGATWFKRYQALYNDMIKRQKYQSAPYAMQQTLPVSYYAKPQLTSNVVKSVIPAEHYAYNYVYPLYHLHPDILNYQKLYSPPSYDLRPRNTPMQLRSRNVVPGLENSKEKTSLKNVQKTKVSQILSRQQPVNSMNNGTHNYGKGIRRPKNLGGVPATANHKNSNNLSDMTKKTQSNQITATHAKTQENAQLQDHVLQNIGLKDDASFMEAKPNFDQSQLTLHAVQSMMPKTQGRNLIPRMPEKPNLSRLSLLKNSAKNLIENNTPVSKQSDQNTRVNEKEAYAMTQNELTAKSGINVNQQKPGLSMGIIEQERSEIARPKFDSTRQDARDIALSFYTEMRRPTIALPPDPSEEKRDVIYTNVNPSSEVDSDEVTAENLAAIFNELDGELDRVLQENSQNKDVTKKDVVARVSNEDAKERDDLARSQDEIEMTVYDSSTKTPKNKSVQFINTFENETNFEQNLGIRPIDTDETAGVIKDTMIRPRFDLEQLHYGLRNGNTFE